MIHFHIITLFPDALRCYLDESIIGRAQVDKKIRISYYNPRDYTDDPHKRVDKRPYGGGPGMVLSAEPVLKAAKKAIGRKKNVKVLFCSAAGKSFTGGYAKRLAGKYKHIVIIAGHYEGVDERVRKILKAEPVSVGDFILTGGEIPALAIVDAISRFVPGVLGNETSLEDDRTASPEVYTRPEAFVWRGKKYTVPRILLSGDHKKIDAWKEGRRKKS